MVLAEVTESGRHAPYVYVVAVDPGRAREWARINKPQCIPRICSADSRNVTRGLWIPDEPVYVLDDIPQPIREQWALTGANLIYV